MEAAERALQDGDEGGFEFQNMLASEITEAWHIACIACITCMACHGHGLAESILSTMAFNCTWYAIDMDLALLISADAPSCTRRK